MTTNCRIHPRPAEFFRNVFLLVVSLVCNARTLTQDKPRLVHVFVALADNAHQGIVPVSATLGNGDDPQRNLYWGAAFGMKTFFQKSAEWRQVAHSSTTTADVLERIIFVNNSGSVYLIADAYRGAAIKQAITNFLESAAGIGDYASMHMRGPDGKEPQLPNEADLSVYVGHDGLMDFAMDRRFSGTADSKRQVLVLACASRAYFGPPLKATGAQPLLLTTGLMAPEAYTLKAALDGWVERESPEQIRERAAGAYAHCQEISLNAARRLFTNGW